MSDSEHEHTTTETHDEAGQSRMGRDLQRLLAIRDCCRSFLLGELRFGLMLDGVEAWSDFEQLSNRWREEFQPHLNVFYDAFATADRNRVPLPTRDDQAVADGASAIVSMISRLLGDDVPLALPTNASMAVASGAPTEAAHHEAIGTTGSDPVAPDALG